MKAKVCQAPRVHHDLTLKTEKLKASRKEASHFDNAEMQECFLKLKTLVPGLTETDAKLSKVQVLQAVIDYILELEVTLDFDPLDAANNLIQAERRPLAESSHINTQLGCAGPSPSRSSTSC